MASFRDRMLAGEVLVGTFVKTPEISVIEVLAQSELDFVCLDAEHAPFDRARMDACLAIGKALNFPVLVRVGDGSPREILQALDSGAVGLVVPHVDSVAKAEAVAKSARFGHGGRGFAGSTRWAGFATRPMPDVLAQTSETIVMAQIEEPEGVEAAAEIAGVEGIDALFVGPADLSVSYGHDHQASDELADAIATVGAAAKAAGVAFVTFVTDAGKAKDLLPKGISVFFVASEQTWMRDAASREARAIKA